MSLAAALAAHDEQLARRKVDVWIGAEPTFTRAESVEAAWTSAAEGSDKIDRARSLAEHLAAALRDAAVTRVLGRTYPGEDDARFAFGVRWRDDRIASASPLPAAPISATASTVRTAVDAPPTDLGGDHWLTVTPDPGVVEVNMAPCATGGAFLEQAERVWAAAATAGLSPLRYRFNGEQADSGGGGQLTLGGATPTTSPFVRYPHVLPALIRYFNNHPSLSYWFASECVGSASQGPRPDEGVRERYDELGVGLAWLEQLADRGELSPDQLWHALAPLLVDNSGNSHRAELNVEKLWNPHLAPHGPRHGKLGVVELRAVRMPERPGMLAALAALVRSIVARLVVSHYREPLVDWHDELHDRFALPAALHRDLRLVLGDLDEHGLGVPAQLRVELEAWRAPGILCQLGDATLVLRPALEFWPLVGDVASQEQHTSRWVDASTERWELSLDGPGPDRVAIAGAWASLRALAPTGTLGDTRCIGVRRRAYQPSPGLHPGMPANEPLVIEWSWAGKSQRIELFAWRPSGGPYDGLPADADEALDRRNERVAITTRLGAVTAFGHHRETRPFTIDLRMP